MKRKLLFAIVALMCSVGTWAETDYTSLMSSTWTNSTGNFGGGKERYQGGSDYQRGKIMYQSFTAPAAGIYEIKFYAVASSTSGRGWTNVYGDNIAQAYATAGGNTATVPMTVIDQTGCTLVTEANIRTLSVEAAEGETIEYGIENIATGGNWYTIKELSAKMKTVAEIFQDQYDEAYAIWKNSTENENGAKATFKTYVDAMNTALTGTLAEAQTASNNLAAALVTYESKSYPVKGSGVKYDFTSKMNMAINAWTCKQGNGPAQYGFTGATETYGNTGAGEVMYQTISGLANGEYEIHFYAVANAANGGGTASEASEKKVYVYANDQTLDIGVISQNSCTPSDYERAFTVMVKDGTIKYGITNNDAAGNWYICKNVALYMTGAPDLSDYYDAIAEQLTKANNLKSENMNAGVLSALQAAIDATEGYESITVTSTLETLSSALITANNNATTSIENYALAKTILEAASTLDAAGQASYSANETIASIQSAYNAKTLESVSSAQETASTLALRTAAKAQTTAGADMTLAIDNPEVNGIDGWTVERPLGGNGPLLNNVAMEYWAGNASNRENASFDYYQVITDLRDGKYTISAEMYNSLNNEEDATFSASSGVYGKGSTEEYKLVDADGTTLIKYTTDAIVVTDGTLRIGVKNVEKMAARWFVADNFKLTYVEKLTISDYKDVLADAITNAKAIDVTTNVGDASFQIPSAAVTDLTSAIAAAQTVYDNNEATTEALIQAIKDLQDAEENYANAELNAPAADQLFNVILTYSGYTYDQKAITYIAGGRNDQGGYNLQYKEAANKNLAQAFTFTKVSGNNYKMSQIDADGVARYVSTGVPYGGNTAQIRTTTDASKALVVTVIPTATEGVYNLRNTEANQYIGSQDDGVYTVNSHINFNIVETTKPSITINTTAAGWGTTILPFAVDALPAGVKAYTCAEVADNTLTLVEVDALEANNPYIIEGAWNETVTGDAQGIALTNDKGLLVGTYERIAAPNGKYVLQNGTEGVGFYLVDTSVATPYVPANRAYLNYSGNNVKAFIFGGGEDAIKSVFDGVAAGEIYDLSGRKVAKMQKGGAYIVNGKKVIVK